MIVVIDVGHGMHARFPFRNDPGAVAGGFTEADIALEWALTLKHYLTTAGIKVYMTRDSKISGMPTRARALWARSKRATHFISIHCNAASSVQASGTETLYRNRTPWVNAVHNAAVRSLQLRARGVKHESQSQHRRLAVLGAPNPCMVELGFITNPGDRERLLSRERRIAFAQEIVSYLQD
jgi:N-acetylmuramoyl-L-alanine amidase